MAAEVMCDSVNERMTETSSSAVLRRYAAPEAVAIREGYDLVRGKPPPRVSATAPANLPITLTDETRHMQGLPASRRGDSNP